MTDPLLPLLGGDPPHCAGCPRHASEPWESEALPARRWIAADGLGSNGVMIVGDSPWLDETLARRNFAGASGSLLERMMRRVGTERSQYRVVNAMACRPPHLGWTDRPERQRDAAPTLEHCRPFLDREIERFRPRAFVLMGGVALERVAGVSGIEAHAAYVLPTSYGVPAVAAYHPAYLLRGNRKLEVVDLFALKRALALAAGTERQSQYTLLLDPPPGELEDYVRGLPPRIPTLIVDIETPESANLDEEEAEEVGASFTIIRAGFSARRGEAVTFPFVQPYVDILAGVLSRADLMVEHADNHFDSRRLRAAGLPVPERVASSMWLWHWFQSDLRKGLGACAPFAYCGPPWKHLAEGQPAHYNAMDNAVTHDVWEWTRERVVAQGRWRTFERHCLELDPILVRMGRAGIARDDTRRDALRAELQAESREVVRGIDQSVDEAAKKLKRWKAMPRDVRAFLDARGIETRKRKGQTALDDILGPTWAELREATGIFRHGEGWARYETFNPDSTQQVATLIRSLGLKVPQMKGDDGEERDTTGAKHLKRFAKRYAVFGDILKARQLNTYATLQLMTMPLNEGRLVTQYGWHPSTWRKSSRNANLQVMPKRADLSARFRQMFVAAPGHVLMESDSAAIEAVMVGYFARSERFIRLAKAGIHGWMAAAKRGRVIDPSIPFDELKRQCKAAKRADPTLYDTMKRGVYMSLYLGTPERLWEEYPDDFRDVRHAKEVQDFIFSTEPGRDVRRWQRETCERAAKETFLQNPWGYRHWFYATFDFNYQKYRRAIYAGVPEGEAREHATGLGDDAKRAVAFLPQSTASAIQSEIVLNLAADERVAPWMRLIVHDSLVLEVPEECVEEVAPLVYAAFVRPWDELGGLAVGAELSVGRNLGPRSETNPEGMAEWHPSKAEAEVAHAST